jgi:Ca2+-binding EF-hand superfamily protein
MLKFALGLLALSFLLTPLTSHAQEAAPEKKLTKAKEKYDADKDGRLSDEEKAAAKEGAKAKAKETRAEKLAKYDANGDGKLDDAEKARMKTDEQAEHEARKAEREAKKAAKEAEKK